MDRCPRCKDWMVFPDTHRCRPQWQVWQEGEEKDDASTFFAFDAAKAAEMWADDYDCNGDYDIVRGSPATVFVQGDDGVEHKFEVIGESVPQYTAYCDD